MLVRQQSLMVEKEKKKYELIKHELIKHESQLIKTHLIFQVAQLNERFSSINKQKLGYTCQNQIMMMNMQKDIKDLKRELGHLQNSGFQEQPLQCSTPLLQNSDAINASNSFRNTFFEPEDPHIFLREALKRVPEFNGDAYLHQFILACHRAKKVIPPSAEWDLTKLLINKLSGDAYTIADLAHCKTVEELIDTLSWTFDQLRCVEEYYKELFSMYQKRNESVLSYIQRIKDFRTLIIDAKRRECGSVSIDKQNEIDATVAKAFCQGLLMEFRLHLSDIHYTQLSEAFSYAIYLTGVQCMEKPKTLEIKKKMPSNSTNNSVTPIEIVQKNNSVQENTSNYSAENQKNQRKFGQMCPCCASLEYDDCFKPME